MSTSNFWVGDPQITITKAKVKGKKHPCIVFETNGNSLRVAMTQAALEELASMFEEMQGEEEEE